MAQSREEVVETMKDVLASELGVEADKVTADCLDFDPAASLGPKEAKRLDRSTQFALTSAREAWDDSRIEDAVDKDETGVVFATGIGGINSLLASGEVVATKGPHT